MRWTTHRPSRRLATALIACSLAVACGGGGGAPGAAPAVTVPSPEPAAGTSKTQMVDNMLSVIEVTATTRGMKLDEAARGRLRTAVESAVGLLERDSRGRDASLGAGMLDRTATDAGTEGAKSLAAALLQRATGGAISTQTVDAALKPSAGGGVCPLYPFC